MTPSRLARHIGGMGLTGRLTRCMSVSVSTRCSARWFFVALAGPVGMSAWIANVFAIAVGTVRSYLLNRRRVWRMAGRSDVWRQVVPFWVVSFAGLVLATVAVAWAAYLGEAVGVSGALRSLLLVVANISSFAALWAVQFVLLDGVLLHGARGHIDRGAGSEFQLSLHQEIAA